MCSCPMPGGLSSAHCARCHRNFTSVSAFDQHITIGTEGLVCHDPEARRLVLARVSRGVNLWGWPGSKPARPAVGARISATNEDGVV